MNKADDQLVSVYRASSPQQAALVKQLLEGLEIECVADGDALQNAGGELPVGWASAPKIRVWKKDEEEARQIIEEFERGDFASDKADMATVDYSEVGFEWPECPNCQESRQAFCPFCQFVGLDFETETRYQIKMNDQGEVYDQGWNPFLLKCPICAEKHEPAFIDNCRICKHEFVDFGGTSNSVPIDEPEVDQLNLAVVATTVLILGFIALAILYFVLLI